MSFFKLARKLCILTSRAYCTTYIIFCRHRNQIGTPLSSWLQSYKPECTTIVTAQELLTEMMLHCLRISPTLCRYIWGGNGQWDQSPILGVNLDTPLVDFPLLRVQSAKHYSTATLEKGWKRLDVICRASGRVSGKCVLCTSVVTALHN